MSSRRAYVAASLATVLVGAAVAVTGLPPRAVLLLVIATAILLPVLRKAISGSLDPLEPLVMASAAFLVLFLMRPLYDFVRGDVTYLDFNPDSTYDIALAAAASAILSFQLGYAIARVPSSVDKSTKRLIGYGQPRQDRIIVIFAIGLTTVGAVAALANAIVAGGAESLLQDRTAIASGATNIPAIAIAVSAAVPAVLLLWCVEGPGRQVARAMSLIPMVVLGIAAIPKGDRRLLLPLAVAGGAFYYLRKGRRPSAIQIAAVIAATMFLIITPLREARTGQVGLVDAFVRGIEDPTAAVEDLLISQDTAHLNVLAVLISQMGDDRPIPWQWGMATLTETVLQPIPRQLWEGKPSTIRTQFIEQNWGMAGGRCVSQCPTLSLLGTLYADLGLLGVTLGCFVLGWFARFWYLLMLTMRGDGIVSAAYSATLFTFFFVWWSSLGTVVVDFALYAVPVLLAGLLARQRRYIRPTSPERISLEREGMA